MRNMIKKIAMFAGIAGILCSCVPKENTTGTADKNMLNKRFVIGYCINNIDDVFQVQVLDAVKAAITEAGGELEISNAEDDPVKQHNQVSNFANRNIDGLIVVLVDAAAASSITDIAIGAGIPLCYVNRNPFEGKEYTMPDGVYFAGSEEIIAGRLQADYAGKQLKGQGNVAILMGLLENTGSHERTKGNKEIFAEKYPDINVIAVKSAGWQRDKAFTITRQLIKSYGKNLDAILANNDEMAIGAIKALHELGADNVLVFGIDGTTEGKAAVQQGKMIAPIFQDAKGQGESAAKVIMEAMQGNKSRKISLVPFRLIDKQSLLLQETNTAE